jgi:hypothetical protein
MVTFRTIYSGLAVPLIFAHDVFFCSDPKCKTLSYIVIYLMRWKDNRKNLQVSYRS